MNGFEYYNPVKIVFGAGALEKVGAEAAALAAFGTGVWNDFSPLDEVHVLSSKMTPSGTGEYDNIYARFLKACGLCCELAKKDG